MNLSSSHLEAFFAVAKTLHFTRAAETLHVTQSALSQRIAKLEEELGTTLFIRDRNQIKLTDAGAQVLRYCQLKDSAESELLNRLKDSSHDYAGILRIGGFSSVNRSLVIPALKKMMIMNPRLSVQLFTKELQDLQGLLKSSEADYILTNKKSESANIESLFLGYEDNVLAQAKKYQGDEIYLDHDESDFVTTAYFSQNKIKFKPKAMRYLDDVYGLIDGVKNGYGKAVLPLHLIENDKDIEVLDAKKVLRISVYLQFYTQPFYRKIHSVVLQELQEYFKAQLRQSR